MHTGATQEADPHIHTAIALWEPLAAFAWMQFTTNGRGVVLIQQIELDRAAKQHQVQGRIAPEVIDLGYVCLRDVPPSDDFAPIIAEYDPQRQIVLLLKLSNGDERLYVLETSERRQRPTPRDCYESLAQRD